METKDKFSYDVKILSLIQHLKAKYTRKGYELDTRYIDYFGDICPRCGHNFKVYRGIIQGAASVSAFINLEQNKGVAYCICKGCAKEISGLYMTNDDPEVTEKRIFEKIPDLARKQKADIKEEGRILRKIYEE